jgi:hypothetical protein
VVVFVCDVWREYESVNCFDSDVQVGWYYWRCCCHQLGRGLGDHRREASQLTSRRGMSALHRCNPNFDHATRPTDGKAVLQS